jgi:D-tyrosyl-tRNA(Tyr) deacylase
MKMRAVIQRVSSASVKVGDEVVGEIGTGLLVYVGVGPVDDSGDAATMANKIRYLRIFPDEAGKMNLDVVQAGGKVLVVSNFTLFADVSQGRRPAFTGAAAPEKAETLYHEVVGLLRETGLGVETGRFGAMMGVASENAGPINFVFDTRAG